MPADVRLDDEGDGWVTVEGPILKMSGHDLMLDSAERREGAAGAYRRALVHGPGDTLVVNWANDYTGGVVLNNARVEVRYCKNQPVLPKDGELGQLVVTHTATEFQGQRLDTKVQLWLCLGQAKRFPPGGGADWVPVRTGEAVTGTG